MRSHDLLLKACELAVGPAPAPEIVRLMTPSASPAARPDRLDRLEARSGEAAARRTIGEERALVATKATALAAKDDPESLARNELAASAVKEAIRLIEAPSTWIVAYDRKAHIAELRKQIDQALAESGQQATTLPEADAKHLVSELGQALASPYRDRLTLKATILGLTGPSIVGWAGTFFPSQLSVFVGVLGGMIAGPLMFPLSYRFSAVIKRWICSSTEIPDMRTDTPFQARMARIVHLQNQIFKDPPRDGVCIFKDFTIFVNALLTDIHELDDRDAEDTIARTVLLCREAYPQVEIEKDLAKIFGNRLRKRYGNPESQAAIRKILADEAPAHQVPLADAYRLLDALFQA